MYKKMVVLLDGSKLAEVVFEYAQELAGRLHLDLELLHVCRPEEEAQLPMRQAYIERMAEILCEKADEVRAQYDDAAACIMARGRVVIGYPAEEILEYVDANDIDLIMMSTHGSSGKKTWDLGDLANKIVHSSKVPVWLVPSELREAVITDGLPLSRTIVPLSGEKQSETAVAHALNLYKQRRPDSGGELVLLHVVEKPAISVTSYAAMTEYRADLDRALAEAKSYLENVAAPLREAGLNVRTEALKGEPAESIMEYLKENPTQLLVLATRGKSRLNRMVFGSVSESLIHLVKVTPLLLVSGEE